MPSTSQSTARTMPNPRSDSCIRLILASSLLLTGSLVRADEPPADLAKRVAERERQNEAARNNYTYRQSVTFEEVDKNGARTGDYREVREVIFSPDGERTERMVGKPSTNLKNLRMTEEDFRDLRAVHAFLFTPEQVFL